MRVMGNMTLSVIVAAHHEGLIAHKTMLSLLRATKKLDDASIEYEIIVTVDNGDKETMSYFDTYSNDANISIHHVSFGELAASRNYGVSLANGEYIATLDADDLISENWLINSIATLKEQGQPAILHTHYSVNFGTQDVVWEKFDSRSKEEDAVIMTWANRWDSAVVAPREVFERFPYQPNKNGYGSEDWHFNSQTLAADIAHKIVPKTVLFVRRKDVSEMTIQAADRRTVHYTDLLSIDFLKTVDTTPFHTPTPSSQPSSIPVKKIKHVAKKTAKYIHHTAKHSSFYRSVTQPLISAYKQKGHQVTEERFPSWLIAEWRAVHTIDKSIFPSRQLLGEVPVYHSEMYELGVSFRDIMASFSKEADYIMFLPALWPGGAEVVALNFIKALSSVHPEWHIAVVTTEAHENVWRDRLPKNVDFIDFGNLTHGLTESLRLQLLARTIVQSKATHLHIAQSPLMYRFASLYQSLLKNFTVYAFAFCEDTDDEGRVAGHIHSGLPGAYPIVTKVFSDNQAVIDQLVDEYAFDKNKFITHYQPVDLPIKTPHSAHKPLKILWASRVAKQKRPDILKAIAQQLDPVLAHIDVYGIFENGYDAAFFDNIPALTYKGTFKNVRDLHAEAYDVFLYTSENDGIPNILLEMTANGLVIVAPKVGGIPELISAKTGILIDHNDDIATYVTVISDLSLHYDDYKNRVYAAQDLIKQRHSFAHLITQINRDI